jgi:prophage DNA circulation protein
MAVPAWVDRLRTATFISPSGVESTFKLDILNRVGGKKASMHEILDKDEGIPQDQGNRSISYPCECYFTGENSDIDSNIFFNSLSERFTAQNPGILKHPMTDWGDLAVMPFEFQQSMNLVSDGGIWRVPVEFRTIPEAVFPTPEGIDSSEIISGIDDLADVTNEASDFNVENEGDLASFRAKIRSIKSTISNALSPITGAVESVSNTFRLIENDIDSALNTIDDPAAILQQIILFIRNPASIQDNTLTKLEAYQSLYENIFLQFENIFTNPTAINENKNNARLAEAILHTATVALGEASIFTGFQTRDAAGKGIDFINNSFESTISRIAEISQTLSKNGISDIFRPDHNTLLQSEIIIGQLNAFLLDRSF